MRSRLVPLLALATLVSAGFGLPHAQAESFSVNIWAEGFSPSEVSMVVGDQLTWTNLLAVPCALTDSVRGLLTTLAGNSNGVYTFAESGDYTYTCDGSGLPTGSLHVSPAPTPAPTEIDFTVEVSGLTVTVTAIHATHADGHPILYRWRWGDLSNHDGSGVTATHTYDSPGDKDISVVVNDDHGGGIVGHTVHLDDPAAPNAPPAIPVLIGAEGLTVTVSATATRDADGDDVSFTWRWGDGTPDSIGASAAHTYAAAGAQVISCLQDDGHNGAQTTEHPITLVAPPSGPPPEPFFTLVATGLSVRVDALLSTDPGGEGIGQYVWRWGDGSRDQATIPTASHTYASPGTYAIHLAVAAGARTAETSREIAVPPAAPANYPPEPSFVVEVSGNEVRGDASASSDADGDTLTFFWDWGDGTLATAGAVRGSHNYARAGTFEIVLNVNDGHTPLVSSAPARVSVGGAAAPVSEESFPWQASANGLTLNVEGSPRLAELNIPFLWKWGDGSPDGTQLLATHTYRSVGAYRVELALASSSGGSARTIDVGTANLAPTPRIAVETRGLTATADARSSIDTDGDTLSFSWDWGDGSPPGSGATATHAYAGGGARTIVLTARDATHTARAERTITVVQATPTAAFTSASAGLRVEVDASVSSTPDPISLLYAWSWGDGTTSSGRTAAHDYTTDGAKNIVLTVSAGTVSASAARSLTLSAPVSGGPRDQAPIANFTATRAGLRVSGNASGSHDPDNDPLAFAWSWGDGTNDTGINAAHTYVAPGEYLVTLVANDGRGGSSAAVQTLVLLRPNLPPIADAHVSASGLGVLADARRSMDPEGDNVTFTWSWGDASEDSIGPLARHTYQQAGEYLVELTASDGRARSVAYRNVTTAREAAAPANRPPVAVLLSPAAGSRILPNTTFQGSASDPDGDNVAIEVAIDMGAWTPATGGAAGSWTFTPNASALAPGAHTVAVRASDGHATIEVARATFTVNASTIEGEAAVPAPSFTLAVLVFTALALALRRR